jgi:hypothetical protein
MRQIADKSGRQRVIVPTNLGAGRSSNLSKTIDLAAGNRLAIVIVLPRKAG